MSHPVLYIDFSSPYAYLATMRVEGLLGRAVAVEPILLGVIFERRGWGSWGETERRPVGMADVEARARRYGLHPVAWPDPWPASSLGAARAGIWANRQGAGMAFAQALYGRVFGAGAPVSDPDTLADAARIVGLDPDALLAAVGSAEIKDALRAGTDAAWERGVRGIPTLAHAGRLVFGDDQLETVLA